MKSCAGIAVLALLACGFPLAAIAANAPVTFNVAVKVTNLMPEVTEVAVKCSIRSAPTGAGGGMSGVSGEGRAPVAGGGFDGNVSVPIPGSYTVQDVSKSNVSWQCDLYLVNASGAEQRVVPTGIAAPGSGNAPWSQPGPGPAANTSIGGGFTPALQVNLDPSTGRKASPDATPTPVTVSH